MDRKKLYKELLHRSIGNRIAHMHAGVKDFKNNLYIRRLVFLFHNPTYSTGFINRSLSFDVAHKVYIFFLT